MLKVAEISKSTYYYNKFNKEDKRDEEVLELIKKLPLISQKSSGSKTKSNMIKNDMGIIINHKKMARICKKYGILAQNRRNKHPKDYYKEHNENSKKYPNILNRDFESNKPLNKLCTDVSYFKTTSGWLYLSAIMDLFNREIIAYSMSSSNDEKLVIDSINKLPRVFSQDIILHSDQGRVYNSLRYNNLLEKLKIKQSMSRRGNCWDNACIEHFFGTLKVESGYNLTLRKKLLDYDSLKNLINEYISYYNNTRLVKNLGWKTPVEYKRELS